MTGSASHRTRLKIRLDALALEPNRRLGQHFLVDDAALDAIVKVSGVSRMSHALEVGPGTGLLTAPLLATGATVVAIERDVRFQTLLTPLAETYAPRLTVLYSDVRDVALERVFDGKDPSPNDVRIVSNVPYSVTTDVITNALVAWPTARAMTFLIQKDAYGRLIAPPGSKLYGPLSVWVHEFGTASCHMTLSPSSFWPSPHVTSVVVHLTPHVDQGLSAPFDRLNVSLRRSLHTVLVKLFGQRRKRLSGALKALYTSGGRDALVERLTREGLGDRLDLRLEMVPPKDLLTIAHVITSERPDTT